MNENSDDNSGIRKRMALEAAKKNRPQITLTAGELPAIVDACEQALLQDSSCELYQRGGLIVHPVLARTKAAGRRDTSTWRLLQVRQAFLIDLLTQVVAFRKFDNRRGDFVPRDCPPQVAETFLAREGHWRLPHLLGVTNAPYLKADGTLVETPGYDAESGLLFRDDGCTFPQIAAEPSKDDAVAALGLLENLIATFPFVTDADRTVALSAFLTALDRRAMTTAPLHAFTAPTAGTGKSMLADLTSILATGQLAPVISQGRTIEEFEKRLASVLLQGDTMVSIDNCDAELEGALLCQTLTQQRLTIRLLGQSRTVEAPVSIAVLANGNNLEIVGDLTRRCLLCSMDARCERPELRRFNLDPIAYAQEHRGVLVAAGLTILRGWHVSRERVAVVPFGGFEDWSRRIREPLIWLHCADPCDTVAKLRDTDFKLVGLVAVLIQWREHIGLHRRTAARELIEIANPLADFKAALMAVAANRRGDDISPERLGRWLKRHKNRVVDGVMMAFDGVRGGVLFWKLVAA